MKLAKPNSQKIDHTLLKPEATELDIIKLCEEAIEYNFFSVCINPYYVPFVKKNLKDSSVKVCAVLGFPLGAIPTSLKIQEAQWLLSQEVDEIDMVMNIGAFKDLKYSEVKSEIKAIKDLMPHKVLKVIIETCLLTKEEIRKASEIVKEAGADFVKTSTGFSSGGAKKEDLIIMLDVAKGSPLKVKASGGVKTKEQLEEYLTLGIERIGTSSGISLLEGQSSNSNY